MTKLVSGYLEEIRATETVDGPLLCIIKMGITTVYWEISVSQSATRSVERIPVSVFTFLKSNLNVDLYR